jgi:uncharacterized membrane protein YbhN (UPF0104 family)
VAKGNLWIGLITGVIIYFAMTVYGDYEKVLAAISTFRMEYIPILLSLAFTNYLLRAVKWHYFFRVLGLEISFKENLYVFLSGLLMAVTPGKFGEVWKSWLVRDLRGYDLHRTVPIVFMDRITDVVAMLTLASFGVLVFRASILSFSLVVAILLIMLIMLRSETIMLMIFGMSARFEGVRKAYLNSLNLLHFRVFILAVLISLVAWFMECLAFYLTFRGLSIDAGLFESTFIYAISSVAGALTMLPGGLGVTEASLAGLSSHLLMLDKSATVAATFIIRAVTLWFAVIVGAISYFLGRRLLYQKSA